MPVLLGPGDIVLAEGKIEALGLCDGRYDDWGGRAEILLLGVTATLSAAASAPLTVVVGSPSAGGSPSGVDSPGALPLPFRRGQATVGEGLGRIGAPKRTLEGDGRGQLLLGESCQTPAYAGDGLSVSP